MKELGAVWSWCRRGNDHMMCIMMLTTVACFALVVLPPAVSAAGNCSSCNARVVGAFDHSWSTGRFHFHRVDNIQRQISVFDGTSMKSHLNESVHIYNGRYDALRSPHTKNIFNKKAPFTEQEHPQRQLHPKHSLSLIVSLVQYLNASNRRIYERISAYVKKNCLRNMLSIISAFMSLTLLFATPLRASASTAETAAGSTSATSSSLEYYLQNNPNQQQSSQPQREVISIQTDTHSSLPPGSSQQSPQKYMSNSARGNTKSRTRYYSKNKRQKVQRLAFSILAATIGAASFRASLRKSKIVRNITPFGMIRNTSPLGNGVSVMRVRMALDFANENGDAVDGTKEANDLLEKLQIEEYKMYSTISTLAQQQIQGMGVYAQRQAALGDYVSNGESPCIVMMQFLVCATHTLLLSSLQLQQLCSRTRA